MNLTKHEKQVLKLLMNNARMSDTEMADILKISSVAIGKIRKKLEDIGIIDKYMCLLNHKKMGFEIFAIIMLRHTKKFWEELDRDVFVNSIQKNFPEAIFVCFVQSADVSAVVLQAFRNIEEMDNYFESVRKTFGDYVKIVDIYTFSSHNLLKLDCTSLFSLILNGKEIRPSLPLIK